MASDDSVIRPIVTAMLYFYSPDVASFHFFDYVGLSLFIIIYFFIISFIMIGLLLREALDRRRVRLNMYLVVLFDYHWRVETNTWRFLKTFPSQSSEIYRNIEMAFDRFTRVSLFSL